MRNASVVNFVDEKRKLTVSEFLEENQIGKQIRKIRKERGYTLKQLVDRYIAVGGDVISDNMICMWESGKRRIYADQVFYLCKALHCTPTFLYPNPNENENYELADEVRCFNPHAVEIWRYILRTWDGNVQALMEFMGLYACLPKKVRQDVAGLGCHLYNLSENEKLLDKKAPRINIDYVQNETDRLWQWKQSEF